MENKEIKKSKKGKIIAIVIAAAVVIAAVLIWYSGIIGGISEAEAREIAYQQVPGSEEGGGTLTVYDEFDDMQNAMDRSVSDKANIVKSVIRIGGKAEG